MKTLTVLIGAVWVILFSSAGGAGAAGDSYQKALQLFRSGDYGGSVPYLEEYVSLRPEPSAYYMLGYASYELHDFKKSREYFDAAYLIDPGFTGTGLFARQGPSDRELALVEEVLEMSGAKGQLAFFSGLIVNSALGLDAGHKIQKEVSALIRGSYRADRLFPLVVNVFQARYDDKHLSAVLAWLKTPAGRKMSRRMDSGPSAMAREIETCEPEYKRLGE